MAQESSGNSRLMGYLYAIGSAVCLGLIPLFFIPLQKGGISSDTLLAYRFGFGALLMLPFARLKRASLRISLADLGIVALIGIDFMLSMYFFFYSLIYLPSSVAVPLMYLYPVMVMFIMLFYGEKFSWRYVLVLALVVAGVVLLSQGPADEIGPAAEKGGFSLLGICLALGAGLCIALLNVSLKESRVSGINAIALTFYLLLFSCLYTVAQSFFTAPLQWIGDWRQLGIIVVFAFVTAVLCNIFLIWAIQLVGPTLTSILGVTQPLTSVFCGLLVFGDPMNLSMSAGICIVVAAVFLAILKPRTA